MTVYIVVGTINVTTSITYTEIDKHCYGKKNDAKARKKHLEETTHEWEWEIKPLKAHL